MITYHWTWVPGNAYLPVSSRAALPATAANHTRPAAPPGAAHLL